MKEPHHHTLPKSKYDVLLLFIYLFCICNQHFFFFFIVGIYRAVPIRVNPRVRNVKSVYKTHIDVIHYRKTDSKRLHGIDEDTEHKMFTEERIEMLKGLASKPDIYERLSSALAPSIYEHEDIKKVCLLPVSPLWFHTDSTTCVVACFSL